LSSIADQQTPESSGNKRLAAVTAGGTSVWLDQMRRSLIEGGGLERMVREDSLRGVTSNPAIFEKAILGSPDYDAELSALAQEGLSARELYRRLAVHDVQLAADVLRPVYDDSDGVDGYVSLEVAPRLAHDTEGTLEQARMYWGLVDRPNLMIKIPGTDEGLPAIEQAVYEGMNVNVTLLFSVAAYEQVAEAYIRGLERRHDEGLPLDRHSVASFFVSRVDTEVDRRLEALGRSDLAGRAGLANARAAYRRFREIFDGERFAALRAAGAPVQRPLWASTGVKNPHYSETLYVDGLVGPDTVNTMPLPTLLAAAERSEVTGPTVQQHPGPDLDALDQAGIDLEDVTATLLREGIAAFVTPMNKLLDGIERRREAVVTGRPAAIEADLPAELEGAVADRVRRAAQEDVVRRIWAKDESLWGGGPEIADRLGWLTIVDAMLEQVDRLEALRQACARDGLTDVVLLGMGGSSLAPEVLRRSFPAAPEKAGALRLHVLDSTHPGAIAEVARAVDPATALYLVSTKSGGTIETVSLFRHFHARVAAAVGAEGAGGHFTAITDPGSSLVDLAAEHGFRETFLNDPDIGGRYSALSFFGLVPAALMGVDVRALLESAQVAEQACAATASEETNSGLWLGAALGELALRGRDKLTFVIDEPISSFGLWVEQLIAESTGKQGRGILPVADEPLAAAAAYGPDRVFVHLRAAAGGAGAEHAGRLREIEQAGHPVLSIDVDGAADLGRVFFFAEFATAVAGWVLELNPFDQPNVQEAKDSTARVLEASAPPELVQSGAGALAELVGALRPPGYLAIMAYVPPSDAFEQAMGRLRAAVLEQTGATTTFGYGPRFLHSTGQLHKGGPETGRFLQLVGEPEGDAEIPGSPFGFATLIAAQAVGDLETLRAHGLPAERALLRGDPVAAAVALTDQLNGR